MKSVVVSGLKQAKVNGAKQALRDCILLVINVWHEPSSMLASLVENPFTYLETPSGTGFPDVLVL